MTEEPTITCPKCGKTSYHPRDIEEGYCAYCKEWTTLAAEMSDLLDLATRAAESVTAQWRSELHLDCTDCWADPCSAHGPVPSAVKVRTLVQNYGILGARYDHAQHRLAKILEMPDNTELLDLIDAAQKQLAKRRRIATEYEAARHMAQEHVDAMNPEERRRIEERFQGARQKAQDIVEGRRDPLDG